MLEVARPEFNQAREDLQKMSPREAVIQFYSRHEARLSAAVAEAPEKLACADGCAYCCHFEVEARPFEVLEIVGYVSKKFSPAQLKQTIERASQNTAAWRKASESERALLKPPCPFLVNNSCSIYPVRPAVCRNYHATDGENCKAYFEDPTGRSPNTYISEVFNVGHGSSQGFKNAVESLGLDTNGYNLASAFLEAMTNPAIAKRFASGKKTFLKTPPAGAIQP